MLDNKLVTDCLNKGNLFNNFFTKHFTPISNEARFQRGANFETRERLSYLEFCVDEQNKIFEH